MRFLDIPFLPEGGVKCVLLSAEYFDVFAPKLGSLGIKAVPSPYSPSLPRPVRFHPDMNCRHLGGKRFAVYSDALGLEALTELGAELFCVRPPRSPEYPFDAALNALPFGKYFVHNPASVSTELVREFYGLEPVRVKQGYCACSVAVAGENTVITGDHGIRNALENRGVTVVSADNRGIELPGYSNGFIGGASGLIAPGKLCFTGAPEGVVDLSGLEVLGISWVCLSGDKMLDIGGIVPVCL